VIASGNVSSSKCAAFARSPFLYTKSILLTLKPVAVGETAIHRIAFTLGTEFTLHDLPSFCMERFDEPDELKQVSDTEQRSVAADGYEGIGGAASL
jgi:hypothetical protein